MIAVVLEEEEEEKEKGDEEEDATFRLVYFCFGSVIGWQENKEEIDREALEWGFLFRDVQEWQKTCSFPVTGQDDEHTKQ